MNTFEDLTNRINATREMIDICRTNHQSLGLPEYISDLEISSLQQRLMDLERQVKHETDVQSEEIEVRLETGNLPAGQIHLRTLTTVLGGLQSLTDSVANTLLNQPSNRGPIPQEIMEQNSWILKTVKAGSFELCEADGNKIVGRIIKEKVSKVVGYVDKKCSANLLKVITQSSAGNEKVSWTLNDIQDME